MRLNLGEMWNYISGVQKPKLKPKPEPKKRGPKPKERHPDAPEVAEWSRASDQNRGGAKWKLLEEKVNKLSAMLGQSSDISISPQQQQPSQTLSNVLEAASATPEEVEIVRRLQNRIKASGFQGGSNLLSDSQSFAVMGKALGGEVGDSSVLGKNLGYLGAGLGGELGYLGSRRDGGDEGGSGAQFGHLGGEAGKKNGYLGGRPLGGGGIRKRKACSMQRNVFSEGLQPSQFLTSKLDPCRFEPNAASAFHFHKFIKAKLDEQEIPHGNMTVEVMGQIQQVFFPGRRTRRLMQIWEDKGNKKARLTELELGEGGGKRKKGEHSVMRSNTGMGVRAM